MIGITIPVSLPLKQTIYAIILFASFLLTFWAGVIAVHLGFITNNVVELLKGENQILKEVVDENNEEMRDLISENALLKNELKIVKRELSVFRDELECESKPKKTSIITSLTKEIRIIFNKIVYVNQAPKIREDGSFEISFNADGIIFPETMTFSSRDSHYSFIHENQEYHFILRSDVSGSSGRIFMDVFVGREPQDCS